jgi:uncharacterized membrane protein YvbJ
MPGEVKDQGSLKMKMKMMIMIMMMIIIIIIIIMCLCVRLEVRSAEVMNVAPCQSVNSYRRL